MVIIVTIDFSIESTLVNLAPGIFSRLYLEYMLILHSKAKHFNPETTLTKNVLLRNPLHHQHVFRNIVYFLYILPKDSLADPPERLKKDIAVVTGKDGALVGGAQAEVHDSCCSGARDPRLQFLQGEGIGWSSKKTNLP